MSGIDWVNFVNNDCNVSLLWSSANNGIESQVVKTKNIETFLIIILNSFKYLSLISHSSEERMLSQYEELMSFDDQYIHDTIAMLSTAVVVCPVCQKYVILFIYMFILICFLGLLYFFPF